MCRPFTPTSSFPTRTPTPSDLDVVLGIDPGTRFCGWALVRGPAVRPSVIDLGVWKLPATSPLHRRLVQLSESVVELVSSSLPAVLVLEQSFVRRNVRSAMVLAHARGAVIAAACGRGLALAEYHASEVKQAVAGSGQASKERVARMACLQTGFPEVPAGLDSTDALALALTHLHRSGVSLAGREGPTGKPKPIGIPLNATGISFDLQSYLERIGNRKPTDNDAAGA